jgi:tetratricopeptide (TPR) repeat protein
MFRDPRVLEPEDRAALVTQLRSAVELEPHVPEIRVLLGMALSVDLKVQDALEELRESARQAPDCFIAQLKFGELLMRLRICDQAAEHTQKAAELAGNDMQAELARRQAATIRTMRREGIERGGFNSLVPRWMVPSGRDRKKSKQQDTLPVLAGSK